MKLRRAHAQLVSNFAIRRFLLGFLGALFASPLVRGTAFLLFLLLFDTRPLALQSFFFSFEVCAPTRTSTSAISPSFFLYWGEERGVQTTSHDPYAPFTECSRLTLLFNPSAQTATVGF